MADLKKLFEKKQRLDQIGHELDRKIRAEKRVIAQAEARERTNGLLEIAGFIFSREHGELYGADWRRCLEMVRSDPRRATEELNRLTNEILERLGTKT
jgi:hypothetical protein